ncbi:MAG TPA: efflux RND transporter periplasmic adaptor subunit [Phycisphaerae bacterium]|nr:efflux RND transporter periplasmic adaptor subunit [Phycisphaerae bacterium]
MSESRLVQAEKKIIRTVTPLAIIAAGIGVMIFFVENKPRAQRVKPQSSVTLIKTVPLEPGKHQTIIEGMGTVEPSKSISLIPQVAGRVEWISSNMIPGGRFKKGEVMLQIEKVDYQLIVEQRKSEVSSAEKDLRLEVGQQAIAKREYEMLKQSITEDDKDLVLREPYMKYARANLAAAKAALEDAELNLKRTTMTAPFNCSVESESVDPGSQLAVGSVIAQLAGTDDFWIETSVPVDQLQWLNLNGGETQPKSYIYNLTAWGKDAFRVGYVKNMMMHLETEGRMARLLVNVVDPLCMRKENHGMPRLILGMYVRVNIEGKTLTNVYRIDRGALHDGDRIYIMTKNDKLEIRTVDIVWRGNQYVFVEKGITPGERLIVTDMPVAVEGMSLREAPDDEPADSQPSTQSASQPAAKEAD